jgi:hypothetical protein
VFWPVLHGHAWQKQNCHHLPGPHTVEVSKNSGRNNVDDSNERSVQVVWHCASFKTTAPHEHQKKAKWESGRFQGLYRESQR